MARNSSRALSVFSNLAISLDGKIADRRQPAKRLGGARDRRRMEELRAACDVVIFGAATLRAYPHCVRLARAPGGVQPVNAVVSASGELDAKMKFWQDSSVLRFVFTTAAGLARARAAARDRAFVIAAGKSEVDPERILRRLAESGFHRVLVEGGGELMASFIKARLLQELHVTLTPWLVGGRQNPSLVGGEGLANWAALELCECKKIRHELYLRYRVKGARRVR